MVELEDGPPEGATLLHEYQDDFEWLRVAETQDPPLRMMYFEDNLHGVLNTRHPQDPVLTYVALMMGYARGLNLKPARILMGGLGGCAFLHAAAAEWPAAELVSVEINPRVIELARRFFLLSPEARVEENDIRHALEAGDLGTFDLLLCDCYGAHDLPPHLMTRNFMQAVATSLENDGLAMFNFAGADANAIFGHQLVTMLDVFGRLILLQTAEAANVAVFAATDPNHLTPLTVSWQERAHAPLVLDRNDPEAWPEFMADAVVLDDDNLSDTLDEFGLCC
ncbi:spermidine synthase [Sulfidibacter corallicola]